jgi:hypothetical protein
MLLQVVGYKCHRLLRPHEMQPPIVGDGVKDPGETEANAASSANLTAAAGAGTAGSSAGTGIGSAGAGGINGAGRGANGGAAALGGPGSPGSARGTVAMGNLRRATAMLSRGPSSGVAAGVAGGGGGAGANRDHAITVEEVFGNLVITTRCGVASS